MASYTSSSLGRLLILTLRSTQAMRSQSERPSRLRSSRDRILEVQVDANASAIVSDLDDIESVAALDEPSVSVYHLNLNGDDDVEVLNHESAHTPWFDNSSDSDYERL
ncbi:hypothetical protein AYL99_11739 [Fonsecaea erecta]|uniref:Uncharacterized protein n=1 Tax=Fonsecaea erecta TaxID=1367422 RepID=A0A178Z3B4_9EURO|nr:hypothetical protein AYL99_11739 [Fonsecaea erecta]OAP54204.1 hypothetical protein AYL99_11739 [Fonsecaea erecta]